MTPPGTLTESAKSSRRPSRQLARRFDQLLLSRLLLRAGWLDGCLLARWLCAAAAEFARQPAIQSASTADASAATG